MSLKTKIFTITIIALLICLYGCGSNGTPKETQTKANVEQKAVAKPAELQPQKVCPVMGGEIDKSIAPVEKNGVKIYMCCEHCREELTKNFDENVEKLKKLGQKPEGI